MLVERVTSLGSSCYCESSTILGPRGFHNITDYVWEHGETFDERPLCRVDSLVFSQLCYFQLPTAAEGAWGWEGLPIHDLWRSDWLDEMCGHMYDPPGAKRLVAALAASPRYRDVPVFGYVMQIDRLTRDAVLRNVL